MAELTSDTREALLSLARTPGGGPLDLEALMTVGRSAPAIVDALVELDARRLSAEPVAS